MPTKHGLGYRRLIKHKNGPALFGAWCSLVQVLSRHPKKRQGYLTDNGKHDGRPYTAEDLEILTDIPARLFLELFQVASTKDVAWLKDTARIPQGYCADTTGPLHSDLDLDSDLDSNSDSKPTVTDGLTDSVKHVPFREWTADNLRDMVIAANHDGLLDHGEVEDFVAYWMEPSTTGKSRLSAEKNWDTRRRMHNAVKSVYARQRDYRRSRSPTQADMLDAMEKATRGAV